MLWAKPSAQPKIPGSFMAANLRPTEERKAWWWGLAALLMLLLAPSSKSLWIDEAMVARVAMISGDLSGWWHLTAHDIYSEPFKPGHTLFAFIGATLFGTTEYAMRAANLLWAAVAVVALVVVGRRLNLLWLPLAFAAHPFVWFYVDEVRPYAMQLAGGSLMLAGLLELIAPEQAGKPRRLGVHVFWCGALVTFSASMLGALAVASAAFAYLLICLLRRRLPGREVWLWSAPWVVVHVLLSVFYYRLLVSVEGKAGAMLWPLSAANIGFAGYELLGFSGLGPGRDVIRESAKSGGLRAVLAGMVAFAPGLLLYGLVQGAALLGAARVWLQQRQRHLLLVLVLVPLLSTLLMTLGAYRAGWPFWGRHLAPTLPFLFALIGFGLVHVSRHPNKVIGLWLVLMLGGSLMIRFSGLHSKDDYRSAASLAKEALAEKRTVWWAADMFGAGYYGLAVDDVCGAGGPAADLPPWPPTAKRAPGRALLIVNLGREDLDRLPLPDLVVLSKPDIYDNGGSLKAWVEAAGFKLSRTLPAFTTWERQPTSAVTGAGSQITEPDGH
jgi:hypothetical protein